MYKSVVNDEKSLKRFHNTVLSEGRHSLTSFDREDFDCFFSTDEGFSKYSKNGALHEAGFDSFITGIAFIGMCYFQKYEDEVARKTNGDDGGKLTIAKGKSTNE